MSGVLRCERELLYVPYTGALKRKALQKPYDGRERIPRRNQVHGLPWVTRPTLGLSVSLTVDIAGLCADYQTAPKLADRCWHLTATSPGVRLTLDEAKSWGRIFFGAQLSRARIDMDAFTRRGALHLRLFTDRQMRPVDVHALHPEWAGGTGPESYREVA